MFFATTNNYSIAYISFCLVFTLIASGGKIKIEKHLSLLFVFIIAIIGISLLSNEYLYPIQLSLLAIFLIASDHDSVTIRKSLFIIIAFGVLCAIVSIFAKVNFDQYSQFAKSFFSEQYYTSIVSHHNWDNTTCGLMPQVSHAAGYLLTAIFALLFTRQRDKKFVFICAIIVLTIALIFTGKRAHLLFGILSILLCSIVIGDKKYRDSKIIRYVFIGFVLVTILYLALPLFDQSSVFVRLFDTAIHFRDEDVSTGRFSLYAHAIDMIKSNPIFGNGWGSFKATSIMKTDAHNVYLQIFAECGIFVLLLYILTLFGLIRSTVSLYREYENEVEMNACIKGLLKFSYSCQLFFILYGLTGNDLYNIDFFAVYIFSIAIMSVVRRELAYG